MAYNFDKFATGVDYQGFPYDYYSIMHYDSYAFSNNNLPTMVPLQPGVQLIDNYKDTAISDIDVAEIRKAYVCV